MKFGWATDPLRAIRGRAEPSATAPSNAAIETGDGSIAQRLWFNVLVVCGADAEVMRLHRTLTHAQPLPWRPAEEVEREVVYLAMLRTGQRVEALGLEDILRACEEVESRHLIDNGAIARHFRNLWHTSSAYCKHFMRGLLALKPGDAAGSARTLAPGGLFREGFSLTRVVLPPYRVLQGSYRYAGRDWCVRNWGTPEDARLVASRVEAAGNGRQLAIYEFETVDNAPTGVFKRLVQRNTALSLGCVSVDADSGSRRGYGSGRAAALTVATLPPAPMIKGSFSGGAYLETVAMARQLALSGLDGLIPRTPDASQAFAAS